MKAELTDERRAAVCDWARANGLDPSTVSEYEVVPGPDGPVIHYTEYVTHEDGRTVSLGRTTPLLVPFPKVDAEPKDGRAKWTAPDGLYFRYASALHDADTHSCELGEGVQYSLLLGAVTSIRDEEMERLRTELAEAQATIGRVRHALMNQNYLTSLDESIAAALDGQPGH